MTKLSKKNEWREGIGQIEYGPLENAETLEISKEGENAQHTNSRVNGNGWLERSQWIQRM